MLYASSKVVSENAGRYRQQLAKHFAHKVDVREVETGSEIQFSCGTARLASAGSELTIDIRSENETDLADTKDVIERHLLRFASREELGPLSWA